MTDQGLLPRNPSLTHKQFCHHWYHNHAPLVVPFFLHSGITEYSQIHGPLIPLNPSNKITAIPSNLLLELTSFSGAVPFPPKKDFQKFIDTLPEWKRAYYEEVILVDERRFLTREALECIVRVEGESVRGERRVVIEGGEVKIEVGQFVWEIWREYEKRGGKEEGVGM